MVLGGIVAARRFAQKFHWRVVDEERSCKTGARRPDEISVWRTAVWHVLTTNGGAAWRARLSCGAHSPVPSCGVTSISCHPTKPAICLALPLIQSWTRHYK